MAVQIAKSKKHNFKILPSFFNELEHLTYIQHISILHSAIIKNVSYNFFKRI